jgi:hypothetical protein
MVVDTPATKIQRHGSNQGHLVVGATNLADLPGGRLKVVFHDHPEALPPGLLRKRSGAVFAAQELGTNMNVHIDHALVANVGQSFSQFVSLSRLTPGVIGPNALHAPEARTAEYQIEPDASGGTDE